MGKLSDELKTYNRTVLDHFENPRNLGTLADASLVVTAENPGCQDIVKFAVRVRPAGVVSDVRYKIMGCTVAIATASVLSEMMRGKSRSELASLTQQDLLSALGGLPDHKVRCTGAPLSALKKILEQIPR